MRLVYTFIFILFCVIAHSQVISFHDDSLKINKIIIDASTTPKQLDLLLGAKHSTIKTKSDFQINTHTGKKNKQVIYYYPALGLSFRKYKEDPSKFSFSVKFSNTTDPKDELVGKLLKPFSGYLFIVGNDLTKAKTVDDIKKINNIPVSFQDINRGSVKTIIGAEILYQKDIIRLSFDRETKEIMAVYFYHNFKK